MADSNTIGKLFVQLLLDDDEFDLEEPERQIKEFGAQLDGFASQVEEVFTTAAKAVAAATAGIVASSAVVGANFQAQMTQVGVIAGATGDEFQALTDKARELGASTAFSATEAADAMGILAGAGLSVNEVISATGDVLNLAGAGGTTLDVAASTLASTLSQFQLTAGDAAQVVDVFAKVTAASQFRVEDLAEAMKYGGTVGAGFGWSLEQTVAALAMFRDMGLQGSAAGTALRSAMVGATQANAQNIAVLAKYGLTMAEINPETHSFAEILQTVGKVGITTSDAMVVFGTEAGAAFATLARAAADGDTKYQDMLTSLENASGTAAEMFGTMQDNVLGDFKNLQSGAEEILLAIFDTMKGPLSDVLQALSATLGEVITYFKANGPAITAALQTQADRFIGWLQTNQELIAVAFTDGAKAVVELIDVLGRLAPMLDEIAILVTAIFVAKKVLDFAMALQTLVDGFMAVRTAILATDAALTVSTGGMYAAVVAVGALVTAIGTLIYQYVEAENAADRLREAQDRLAKNNVTQDAARAAALEAYLTKKRAEAQAELEAGAASGNLSEARRKELELLTSLTGATAQQMEAAGKLVVINGELRTVSSIVDEGDVETVHALTSRVEAFSAQAEKAKKNAQLLQDQITEFEKAGGPPEGYVGTYFPETKTKIAARSIEELTAQMEEFKRTAAEYQGAASQITSDAGKANVAALDAARAAEKGAKSVTAGMQKAGEEAEKAAKKAEEAWERAFQTATAASASALARAREQYEDTVLDGVEKVEAAHARELADLKATREKALAEVKDNDIATMIVEKQFAEARTLMEKRQAVEIRRAKWEEVKKELEARQKTEEAVRNLEDDSLSETKKLELERAAFIRQHSTLSASQRARVEAVYAAKIEAIHQKDVDALTALEREGLKRSKQIDLERVQFFKEHTTLTTEERARAERVFTDKKKQALAQERAETVAAVKQTASDVLSVLGTVAGAVVDVGKGLLQLGGYIVSALGGVVEAAKEAVKAITSIFTAITGGEVSLDVLSYISEAIDKITSGEAGGASVGDVAASLVEEMAANAHLFLDSLVEGLPDVVDALLTYMPELVQAVAEALPTLAEEVAALVPEVVATLAENIPILLQGIADALPIVIEALVDAIPDIVAVIADAVPMILEAVVEQLPILIAGIAQAIPDLVAVIVDNLPTVVQGIVDNLPAVVEALAAAIPDIVTAVAEAIPDLVQVVVDQLPVIIDAIVASIPPIVDALKEAIPILTKGLMDALPKLVMGLVNGILEMIPTLIEQLPVVIQGIMDLLPGLISAILGALPEIITAIIRAIPQIVGSILGALPDIIMAIIAAIPDIILALVEELPGMVTDLIVEITKAIPQIIIALIDALFTELIPRLPEIVIELVTSLAESLWDLVFQLWEWLKDAISNLWDSIFGGGDKKDKSSNYSGISFVPATMRGVTLHKGEAVLTAQENARRMFGGAAGADQSNPSAPVVTAGQGGIGPAQALEALFAVDGRIIDGVLLRANENGRGKVTTMMKRRAGVRSGIKTSGRFKLWSK